MSSEFEISVVIVIVNCTCFTTNITDFAHNVNTCIHILKTDPRRVHNVPDDGDVYEQP